MDILAAEHIYVWDIGSLKEKTTWKKNVHVNMRKTQGCDCYCQHHVCQQGSISGGMI